MKLFRVMAGISRVVVGVLLLLTVSPALYPILKILQVFVPVFVPIGLALLILPLILPLFKPESKTARFIRWLNLPISIICMASTCWIVVSLTAIAIAGCGSTPPADATVVVLGEGSSQGVPSLNQAKGIAAAGVYLSAHPKAICVASGRVDAPVIYHVLVSAYKINPLRILIEDQSRTTYENMQFTEKIIKGKGLSRNIAIAAPSFHILRSELLARRVGLTPYGIPGQVDLRQQWPNYFRELLANPKSFFLDHHGFSNPAI